MRLTDSEERAVIAGVVVLMLTLLLAGCGGGGTVEDESTDIDRRYQECLDRGGDFSTNYDNTGFSCELPEDYEPQPFPSASP